MEHNKFDEDELKIPIPSSIIVSGPSSSGKTELVLRLLKNRNKMFSPIPKAVGNNKYYMLILHFLFSMGLWRVQSDNH